MSAITIGLPVYNGSDYLDRALATLAAQDFHDLTILVSDNASTDRTPEIIERWARRDHRICVHRQPHNIGAVANFDWVLEQARSPWFMYAAHDDEWSPNFVATLHAAITARPGLQMAAPQVATFRKSSDRIRRRRNFPEYIDRYTPARQVRLALRHAHPGWFYSLYRRESLLAATLKAKPFGQVWAGDVMILTHLLLTGAITGRNAAIYYRRLTTASAQTYGPRNAAERWRLYRRFLAFAFAALDTTPYGRLQRALMIPALMRYARFVDKPRSIFRAAILELWR